MRVRTIRPHGNAHPPHYQKNRGQKYDPPERTARNLIDGGFAKADTPDEDQHQD